MGVWGRLRPAFARARRRYGWLDHLVRAGVRHMDARAGRLAAAAAYYGFFAAFALSLLGFAILALTLRRDGTVTRVVQGYLAQTLPGFDATALARASTQIGVIALIGLAVTGLAWVKALRGAIRTVWRLEEEPGRFVTRTAIDLLVLIGFGLLLLTSVGVAVAASAAVRWLAVESVGQGGVTRALVATVGFVLGLAVNTVLATGLLSGLPRLKMPVRRVAGPALLVAVGLEVLKTVGRVAFDHTTANPAYQAVANAVGLLLFMYLLNQVVLFAAALTATSRYGEVQDLAVR